MVYVQMANYSKNDSDACFWRGTGRVKQGRIMHGPSESGESILS